MGAEDEPALEVHPEVLAPGLVEGDALPAAGASPRSRGASNRVSTCPCSAGFRACGGLVERVAFGHRASVPAGTVGAMTSVSSTVGASETSAGRPVGVGRAPVQDAVDATDACKGGHVTVNGKSAKPATPVAIGSRVEARGWGAATASSR